MLDFDRFDFNTKGDKITITEGRTGDTHTVNRSEYAKNVKTGYAASLFIAAVYGLGAGLLLGSRSDRKETVKLNRKNKRRRRIAAITNRFAFWRK